MSKAHPKASKNIDAYIASQDSDIADRLSELRNYIISLHDGIEEDWKWGAPGFSYKGLVCWLVSFKEFIGLNFYKGSLIDDFNDLFEKKGVEGKNNRLIHLYHGNKIDLELLRPYIIEAIRLNEDNIKPEPIRKELVLPDFFQSALKKDKVVSQKFESLSYSKKKDYIEWLSSAKREETKQKRLSQALEFIANDIDRHAKYK